MKPEKETIFQYSIQNSKFIGILLPFEQDLKEQLKKIKKEYPKATHYCYAYLTEKEEGMSDDKEPSKTAGLPILNRMKKYHLKNALLVIVRYFGGIKLGTGGLIRAYQTTAEEVIRKASLKPLQEGYLLEIKVDYSAFQQVEYLLKDAHFLEKRFDKEIYIKVKVAKQKKEQLSKIAHILSCKEILF